MCERLTFLVASETIALMFELVEKPCVNFRYNLAPTQQIPVIRQIADGKNAFSYLYWGLIPSYVNSKAFGRRMYNARSETVFEKPAFCQSIRFRRCLVLASGYYEWNLVGTRSQPMYVKLKGTNMMVLAGLWESWKSPKGEIVDSCTILTTVSSMPIKVPRFRASLTDSHQHRMPVILHPDQYQTWVDPNIVNPAILVQLFRSYPFDLMEMWNVSSLVNNQKNDSVDLTNPI